MDNSKLRKTAEKKVDRALKSGVYKRGKQKPVGSKIPSEPKKDVVPVRVNNKTIVYVRRDKCELVNGEWVRKEGQK